MGRDTTGRAPTHEEILNHARWVYDETLEFDPQDLDAAFDKAFAAAVEAALHRAHQGFIIGTLEDILEKAEDLDADPFNDLNDDGPAALIWYAKLLDETLPEEYRLENN